MRTTWRTGRRKSDDARGIAPRRNAKTDPANDTRGNDAGGHTARDDEFPTTAFAGTNTTDSTRTGATNAARNDAANATAIRTSPASINEPTADIRRVSTGVIIRSYRGVTSKNLLV